MANKQIHGFRASGLQAKLDDLEQSKARLQSEIDGAPTPSPRLHPNLAELYRKKVASLQDALVDPATKTEALEILRGLIDRLSVSAGENGFTIELVGEIANMVRLSTGAESLGVNRRSNLTLEVECAPDGGQIAG